MDTAKAILKLVPGAKFNIRNGNIEWDETNSEAQPSNIAILACIQANEYIALRESEYPLLADQLDAIWKGEPYLTEMRNKVLAVKTKYPKPQ